MIYTSLYTREDFTCKCGCGLNAMDYDLLRVLDLIATHLGKPEIHCVWRCEKHNAEIGGAKRSYHKRGIAVDFHIDNTDTGIAYKWLCNVFEWKYGIIVYDWGIHLDLRDGCYRDDRRTEIEENTNAEGI